MEEKRSWWQKNNRQLSVIAMIAACILVIALIVVEVRLYGTGFAGKTLFDWLNLIGILAIPVVAGVLGVWITGMQHKAEQTAEQRQKYMEEEQEKRADENYQLRRFYENINQAYNAAKKVRRLLRATAQNLTPGQDEIMILIEPYDKQMQALVDVQLQFETFTDEIKSNPKLFSETVFKTMKSDLETIEKYLNQIIDEYEKHYKKLPQSGTKTALPISELNNLKDFIDEASSRNEFFTKAHEVRSALRKRLISEIS